MVVKLRFVRVTTGLHGSLGTRSSRHGPYKQGYACVTRKVPMRSKWVTKSKSQNRFRSTDWRLQLALHEGGIVSNRGSARHGECFEALYTPPVTSGK